VSSCTFERRRRVAFAWTLVLVGALGVVVLLSATLGAARIPLHVSAGILLESVGVSTPWANEATDAQRLIVRAIRLPRIVAAAIVGAALALVGATMQALYRNPMADPGIVGVSSGAGLGAVLAIASGLAVINLFVLPAAAFVGALVAGSGVLVFALRRGRNQAATLLLAGIAVTYLCSAATTAVISVAYERDTLREMVFWLLGGFDNRSWTHVLLIGPPIAFGAAVILAHGRPLNLLTLGEEEAQSLGLAVQRTRGVLLLTAALITAMAVSVSGLIGFVGLVVPHLVRLLLGSSDHRVLLPLTALGGACFLLAADTVARVVLQPAELRVGVVTALVGAPCFLWLLARSRHTVREA
jgi:iron complex transport system permease protein